MKNKKDQKLLELWQESIAWLSKDECSKIILLTVNKIRQSYRELLELTPGLWFWFLLSAAASFGISPSIKSIEASPFLSALIIAKISSLIITITLQAHVLVRYTEASRVTLYKKEHAFFIFNKLFFFYTATFSLLLFVLFKKIYSLIFLLLIILFFSTLTYFFYGDRKATFSSLIVSLKNSIFIFIYFLPFILTSILPALTLVFVSFLMNSYLCALLPFISTDSSMPFVFIYATAPAVITLASVIHTKIKYSYFSLFYKEKS